MHLTDQFVGNGEKGSVSGFVPLPGGIGIFLYIGGADVFQRIVAAGDVVQPFVEAASQFVGALVGVGAHVADVELGEKLVDLVNSVKIGCCASG